MCLVCAAILSRDEQKTGDGTYVDEEVDSSKLEDFSAIGTKDLRTLKDKIEAGKDPIDDNTMNKYICQPTLQFASAFVSELSWSQVQVRAGGWLVKQHHVLTHWCCQYTTHSYGHPRDRTARGSSGSWTRP